MPPAARAGTRDIVPIQPARRDPYAEAMKERAYIAVILLLAIHTASADPWRVDAPLYLSSAARYQVYGDRTIAYDSLAAMLQLRASSRDGSFSTGLFADYRFSTDAGFDDIVNLGAVAKYATSRWDHSLYTFLSKSPAAADRWAYFARTRYRIAERHKIGIEAMGLLRAPGLPRLMLGYYGSLTPSLTANVAVGSALGAGPDRAARVEFVWTVR